MADPAVPSREARWTIYVCPGCGYVAGEHDLEPRFGNIVTHGPGPGDCAADAIVVEVAPAAEVERLRTALSNLVSYAENIPAIGDPDAWHGWQDFKANIKQARSAVAAEQGGETDG